MTKAIQKRTKKAPVVKKESRERPLTDREEKFCRNMVLGQSKIDAYRNAGFKSENKNTLYRSAVRISQKDKIVARLNVLRAEAAEKYKLTPNNVMFQTGAILNADIRNYTTWGPNGVTLKPSSELTDEQAAAIEEVSETVTKDGGTVRFKLHNKAKSQELGAKILSMVSDKQETPSEITLKVVYDSGKPKKA